MEINMLNKVQIIGRVGQEPEIRYTQENKPVANLSVATTEKWKDKSGQQQEKTEWHRVVIFGGIAGVVEKYVKKGDLLFVEGKLQTRKWTDNNGQDKYSTEIVLDINGNMVMLGGKSEQSKPQEQDNDGGFNDEVPF